MQRFINADGVVAGASGSVNGYNIFSYCFNNPINADDEGGTWPKWIKKAAKKIKKAAKKAAKIAVAVVAVATVAAAVAVTAGVAALALGASTAIAGSIMTGAAVGGFASGIVDVGMQCVEKGVDNIDMTEAANSVFSGAVTGGMSGGCSSFVNPSTLNVTAKALAQQKFQIGVDAIISTTSYLSENIKTNITPTLYGSTASVTGGFVSGASVNVSTIGSFFISVGLEILGNGEEIIDIFSRKK